MYTVINRDLIDKLPHQFDKKVHLPRTLSDIRFADFHYGLSWEFRDFRGSRRCDFYNSGIIFADRLGRMLPGAEILHAWLLRNDRDVLEKRCESEHSTPIAVCKADLILRRAILFRSLV